MGHGTKTHLHTPKRIASVSSIPIATLIVGGDHNFVISQKGEVWAWGKNDNGQLGVHSGTDYYSPQKVDLKFMPKFGGKAHTFATSGIFG